MFCLKGVKNVRYGSTNVVRRTKGLQSQHLTVDTGEIAGFEPPRTFHTHSGRNKTSATRTHAYTPPSATTTPTAFSYLSTTAPTLHRTTPLSPHDTRKHKTFSLHYLQINIKHYTRSIRTDSIPATTLRLDKVHHYPIENVH